ncbi:MAG: hypothetical protein H6720_13460 [Sandaracinus sp.]|nr:hypothetical protein [Sandaracinus sp.]
MRRMLALLALLAACTVEDGFLDDALFPCEGPQDCGEGWGCVRGTPYAEDFCARECGEMSCDGICTVQGDDVLCLRGCRLREDGTSSECPGEGLRVCAHQRRARRRRLLPGAQLP